MFVFGSLNIDFLYYEYNTQLAHGKIEDCSNADYFCIQSKPFNLALPRSCEVVTRAKVGDVWALGPVRNEILHIDKEPVPPIHGGGSGTTYYIGNPETPDLLYEYDPSDGVHAIYWDQGRARFNTPLDVDFVALARNGAMKSWPERMSPDRSKLDKRYSRVTRDAFGRCGKVTSVSQINRRPKLRWIEPRKPK